MEKREAIAKMMELSFSIKGDHHQYVEINDAIIVLKEVFKELEDCRKRQQDVLKYIEHAEKLIEELKELKG
jgi:hypothetical protein